MAKKLQKLAHQATSKGLDLDHLLQEWTELKIEEHPVTTVDQGSTTNQAFYQGAKSFKQFLQHKLK
jgi:hypothetical protein